MDLKSLRNRLTRIAATVAPPCRRHPGLIVRFVDCIDGKPAPLPDVPHRRPEARDPARGLDVVFLDENGSEFEARCAR
jgi:hypothetical protein